MNTSSKLLSQQKWNPDRYAEGARFVADLAEPLLELLNPRSGERILDLGCGDGVLTQRIAGFGARVSGVDASMEMIERARDCGLDVALLDGQSLNYFCEFDAVFSNAALHWMKDPDAVLQGVAAALKPGGRFVAEFGGDKNIRLVVEALNQVLENHGLSAESRNPWYFPTVEEYERSLVAHGFEVQMIGLYPRPTPIPTGIVQWLEIFAESFFAGVPTATRDTMLNEVEALLHPQLAMSEGDWTVDYVRLRVKAILID